MISDLNIFSCMCLFSIHISSLEKHQFKPFAHFWIEFFFFFCWWLGVLYILWLLISSQVYANMFSYSVGYFFILIIPSECKKLKKIHEVQFVCFSLCCLCLWYHIQNFFPLNPMFWSICLKPSSKCFSSYVYVFDPVWVNFCIWGYVKFNFMLLHAYIQFLQHHLLKRGFPDSSVDKESACNEGNLGLTPGLGRYP